MLDIIGSVILGDATSTEINLLNSKKFPIYNLSNWGYIWMPPVVKRVFLLTRLLLQDYELPIERFKK